MRLDLKLTTVAALVLLAATAHADQGVAPQVIAPVPMLPGSGIQVIAPVPHPGGQAPVVIAPVQRLPGTGFTVMVGPGPVMLPPPIVTGLGGLPSTQ